MNHELPRRPTNTEAIAQTLDMLSSDVHDAYLHSFEPGSNTPFEPKIYIPDATTDSGLTLDITNTPFDRLPPKLKRLNGVVADIVVEALDDQFASEASQIDEAFVYGTMIKASCAWARNMVQEVRNDYQPVESRHLQWHEVVLERMEDYDSTPQTARDIDRDMVLVVMASVVKPEYLYWLQRYDAEELEAIPGLVHFAALGQAVLDNVQARRDAFPAE